MCYGSTLNPSRASTFDEETSATNESVDTQLSHLLSIRPEVSTSSFVEQQQQAANPLDLPPRLRLIGYGTCGKVFSRDDSTIVLKAALVQSDQLWNDYIMGTAVCEAFDRHPKISVHVPRPHYFIDSTKSGEEENIWWANNDSHFPKAVDIPSDVLSIEKIPPLPHVIRNKLIEKYCPTKVLPAAREAPGNKDCLVRLYMGKRRDPTRRPSRFFSLRNFNMCLDQMEDLKLEVGIFAACMGHALAIMHWDAKIDADDVEFVLGCAPVNTYDSSTIPNYLSGQRLAEITSYGTRKSTFREFNGAQDATAARNLTKSHVNMWLLDFNRCHSITMNQEGVQKSVDAFFRNDPYFPRPVMKQSSDQEAWLIFRDCYLETSKGCLEDMETKIQELPGNFIKGVVAEQQRRCEIKVAWLTNAEEHNSLPPV
ncbi:hypothetical protein N7495_005349 [Penicillium taxi]|uniref:uncharacterized protein n=1 Tax=Penicillium taxi TaxID=168475 RepID=UPI0025453043|nr:uncharacterized protein N7495_005349 [Penicillium taxi]KAJ5893658.1 hypothetical protein N7495_005349 [Penicillium taxi]